MRGNTSSRAFCLGVLLVVGLGSTGALAQLPTATILGVVTDESRGVLPGTTVTARHVETGLMRTAVTDGDGSYRIPALPVGGYEIRVELQGFRAGVRTGVTLTVAQEAVVNFTLQVGDITESVTVTGDAPLVNTTNASLGGLVDTTRIESLPLLGRNYIDLTLLQTGVSEHQNINRGTARTGIWFSAKGATLRSNNYLLDGAMMQTLHGSGSASYSNNTLGLDGIQEYRVLTSSFPAEYGMRMGSQTIIASKGGTNEFHGTAFEFYRNSALNARNFFDRGEKPKFTRHNYGGSFGGPVMRNRTFFFGVFEGVRERLGETHIRRTIPASARVDGGLVPQIAPIVKPFLDQYPLPNLPNNEYRFTFTQPTDEYYAQGRIDHNVSANDAVFGRYTFNDSERTEVPFANFEEFPNLGFSQAQYGTLSYNRIISPTVVNTARASFSRTEIGITHDDERLIGPLSFIEGLPMGTVSPGPGITALGWPNQILYKQNVLTLSNDVNTIVGRHSLKYGVLFNQIDPILQTRINARGSISFASVTDFLLARPQNYSAQTPGSIQDRDYRFRTFGFYFQDDLRLSARVTLNLGLRYEFNTTVDELNGLNSKMAFDKATHTFTDPAPGPVIRNSSLRNWSPRVGFAWDVRGDGRTAIRGGSGLLYDIGWFNSTLAQGLSSQPPFGSVVRVVRPATFTLPLVFPPGIARGGTTPDFNADQPRLFEYNLTVDQQLPLQMGLSVAYAGSRGYELPYFQEGNPTRPSQILPDGRKFWTGNERRINPNWDQVTFLTTGARSWYNSLQVAVIKRLSHGLQFQSSYTLSEHTTDENQASLGLDTDITSSNANPDPFDPEHNRGPVSWDVRHNWKFNAIYRLPDSAGTGIGAALLNGWSLSPIVSLQTGYPFTPALDQTRSNRENGGVGDRPDLVPGVDPKDVTKGVSRGCLGMPAGTPVATPELWFDPCAFTTPAAGFLGNAGRNILRAPGLANVNLAITKESALGGSRRLQLRVDVFNLFDRVNLGPPARIVFRGRADVEAPIANAGRITSTSTPSRQIQVSSRIEF